MKYWPVLLLLGGCTSTDIVVPTQYGNAELHSTRFFQQTSASLSADGSFTYSSDPQAQAAADLFKAGLEMGLKVAAATGVPVP